MKQLAMLIGLNFVAWTPVALIVWAAFTGDAMGVVP